MEVRLVVLNAKGEILEERGATPFQIRQRSVRPPAIPELSTLASGFLNHMRSQKQNLVSQIDRTEARSGFVIDGSGSRLPGVPELKERNIHQGRRITNDNLGLFSGTSAGSSVSSSPPCTRGGPGR